MKRNIPSLTKENFLFYIKSYRIHIFFKKNRINILHIKKIVTHLQLEKNSNLDDIIKTYVAGLVLSPSLVILNKLKVFYT